MSPRVAGQQTPICWTWMLFHIVPRVAVKPQVTCLHQLLLRISIHVLCQACVLSPQLGRRCFPFPFLFPILFPGSVSSGWHTVLFPCTGTSETSVCAHRVVEPRAAPEPRTCSDCSVPSAVLLSASSPEFLGITEVQSLPRSKIGCDPRALVPPQLRELQHFLADKKKSALLWGKCLIFALTEQCNQAGFNFVYLAIAA